MLLKERLLETEFSPAEQSVIQYVLDHSAEFADLTIKELAERNFVHPSILIRIAKKMGFSGWVAFKEAFCSEEAYLFRHFSDIDANLPFAATDGIMNIAHKLAQLEKTTLEDTLSLVTHDDLNRCKNLLLRSKKIIIFTSHSNALIAQDFVLKMKRIGKDTELASTIGESAYEAFNCPPDTCALLISYTGENPGIKRLVDLLQQQHVPLLGITSIGDNYLADKSNAVLRLTTRERLFSKIANFTITTSLSYLLDLLYGCVFAENYQKNLAHLIKVGTILDKRPTTSAIIKEQDPALLARDSPFPN